MELVALCRATAEHLKRMFVWLAIVRMTFRWHLPGIVDTRNEAYHITAWFRPLSTVKLPKQHYRDGRCTLG